MWVHAGVQAVDQIEHGLAADLGVAHQVHQVPVLAGPSIEPAPVQVVVALLRRQADQRPVVVLCTERDACTACGP